MEIELADHFDRMNKVVAELLKGNNPTQIASLTGFKRSEVVELIDEWKTVVYNDTGSRERAKEAISGADQHYSMLIKEAWKTVEDADQAGQLNVKANALKLISDIETKRITMLKEVGLLDNAELLSGQARRVVADIGGLQPMTVLSQVWGSKALTMRIVENVLDLAEQFKTTNIFKKLSQGDIVRYRQLGWTEKEFNNIAANIKKHAVFKDGKFQALQLDNWDVEARANYIVGIDRWINRVVQRSDLASLNRWFTTDFARMIIQFRTFSLAAYEKQLLNGMYNLHQTRGKDFQTYSRFLSSMVGSSLFYATQVYINSFGLSNRKEYLDKNLSAENLAKVSFLRSSWSTLIPGVLSTAHSFFSDEDLFGYGRNTGLSSSFIQGIPTVDLIDSAYNTFKMGAKMALDDEYEPTQRDVKKGLSLLILQNGLGFKNFNNMIVDNFVK